MITMSDNAHACIITLATRFIMHSGDITGILYRDSALVYHFEVSLPSYEVAPLYDYHMQLMHSKNTKLCCH